MPAVKSKSARRKPSNGTAKLPPLKKPSSPYPGYMTDEWHEYGMAVLRRTTKDEFRANLLKFGIIDKKGNYTAPYRAD